jgi:predicted TIM-barrel fold metal-dependent hydrolase
MSATREAADAAGATEAAISREAALAPELPIIDPHHHVRDRPGARYLFLDFLADLASCGHNIRATVIIESGDMFRASGPPELRPVGETEFLNGVAAMFASGKYGPTHAGAGIVGCPDLRLGERVRPVIEACIAAGGGRFCGVRNLLTWHEAAELRIARTGPPGVMQDGEFRAGLGCLADYDLCYDAYVYHPQLPELLALVRAVPAVRIIVDHTGGPAGVGPYAGKRDEVFAFWQQHIRELAGCPNVFMKLGGLGLPVMGFGFQHRTPQASSQELAQAWRRYFETCIEAFGPDRCMFESDFPPDKEVCSYTVIWNAFKRIAAGCSADEQAALFGGTAARAYRLKLPL